MVWAFGAVLYEMLTGSRAFGSGDVSDTLAYVLTKEVDWTPIPGDTPAGVRQLLRRCLEHDPRQRLRDIGEARIGIEGAGTVPVATTPEPIVAPSLPIWQRPITVPVALLASLAVGGFAAWSLTRPAPPRLTRFGVSTSPPPFVSSGATPDVVISPDGTRVVYVTSGAPRQLHVRALD